MTKAEKAQRARRYRATPHGQATRRRYATSRRGRKTRARYAASRKGKEVRRRAQRKFRAKPASKLKHRQWQWQRKYGLSEAEYNRLLAEQGGLCAVCQQPPTEKKPLQVDHDHETGKVRGLLCWPCNLVLGIWNDDPKRFVRAADYLLRAQGTPSLN
jgi:hypothetical protein